MSPVNLGRCDGFLIVDDTKLCLRQLGWVVIVEKILTREEKPPALVEVGR